MSADWIRCILDFGILAALGVQVYINYKDEKEIKNLESRISKLEGKKE